MLEGKRGGAHRAADMAVFLLVFEARKTEEGAGVTCERIWGYHVHVVMKGLGTCCHRRAG